MFLFTYAGFLFQTPVFDFNLLVSRGFGTLVALVFTRFFSLNISHDVDSGARHFSQPEEFVLHS